MFRAASCAPLGHVYPPARPLPSGCVHLPWIYHTHLHMQHARATCCLAQTEICIRIRHRRFVFRRHGAPPQTKGLSLTRAHTFQTQIIHVDTCAHACPAQCQNLTCRQQHNRGCTTMYIHMFHKLHTFYHAFCCKICSSALCVFCRSTIVTQTQE